VAGQVVTFLTEHLGNPIPSPVLFKHIGDRFRETVRTFAETNGIPVLQLNTPDRTRWDDRKLDHVREYLDTATQPGVVVIVVAQEVQKVFMGYRRPAKSGGAQFGFQKADRRVTVYYFYILDPAFGLGFIKICSYFPYHSRCGSTVTSGSSIRRLPKASRSPNWPTASPCVLTQRAYKPFAID